jgi:hypothetical protein
VCGAARVNSVTVSLFRFNKLDTNPPQFNSETASNNSAVPSTASKQTPPGRLVVYYVGVYGVYKARAGSSWNATHPVGQSGAM